MDNISFIIPKNNTYSTTNKATNKATTTKIQEEQPHFKIKNEKKSDIGYTKISENVYKFNTIIDNNSSDIYILYNKNTNTIPPCIFTINPMWFGSKNFFFIFEFDF